MTRAQALALALVLTFLAGCPAPAPPSPPPGPDATDAAPLPPGPFASPCQAACDALRSAGCPEGSQADCITVLAHIDGDRLVRTPAGPAMTCASVAAVKSVAEARQQGIRCGP